MYGKFGAGGVRLVPAQEGMGYAVNGRRIGFARCDDGETRGMAAADSDASKEAALFATACDQRLERVGPRLGVVGIDHATASPKVGNLRDRAIGRDDDEAAVLCVAAA